MTEIITYLFVIGAVLVFAVIIWNYVKGLKKSPRDMWFLLGYAVIQYIAYAAINPILPLWLSADCGLSDMAAGNVITLWLILFSCVGMLAGALLDTIGIRKVTFLSVVFIFISRFAMSFITTPLIAFIFGFVPFALGFALIAPVISVSIKRYTTKEGAALGFSFYYVIRNAAYAVGGWLIDFIRNTFAQRDASNKIINENAGVNLVGMHFSSYQILFLISVGLTILGAIVIVFIRDGIEVIEKTDENGKTTAKIIKTPVEWHGNGILAIKGSAVSMGKKICGVVKESYFWFFIGILTTPIFVRFVLFHLTYTFPKYGISVLGEGAKIGSICNVLNPVLIIYLAPLVAALTSKTKSYKMLIIGSFISAASCFIALIPPSFFAGLNSTPLGELVFIKWLNLAESPEKLMGVTRVTEYWPLIFFIFFFTIGELIWSPRLMQFTAEIAPKGKEGTYIALSQMPWVVAKLFVGPMSGFLIKHYTPFEDGHPLPVSPDHAMIWFWIGTTALITPIVLFCFGNFFMKRLSLETEKQNYSSFG